MAAVACKNRRFVLLDKKLTRTFLVVITRSMVGFSESRKMGEHATSGVTSNFRNTIKGMKRLVGLPFDSPLAKSEMQHFPGVTFVPHTKSNNSVSTIAVQVEFGGETKVLPVEHVAGMMIHHMGMIAAEKAAGESHTTDVKSLFPQDWVVTIPPYYTDVQRRALLAGCEMVGIPSVQRLMHENTSTALAFGIFKDLKKEFKADEPTKVMFIDMGASAYTVSIASFEPGKLKVLTCHSDAVLGGRDFDLAIANWVAGKFEEKYGKKLSSKPMEKPKTRLKLLAAAEKAKKTLSPQGVKEASINLEMLQDDFDFHVTLKADEYEAMCQPLLNRLEGPITKCLTEANLDSGKALSVVEIVGGSTRIGSVKRKLMDILKVASLSTTMNADEAVARGAALQSAILSPRFKVLPYDIQESQPYPIEISWGTTEDDAVVMFDRGLSFPVTRRVTLKNKVGPFAVKAAYKVPSSTQEWGLDASLAKESIATFTIEAPKDPPSSEAKIRVNVKQDIHGAITLSSAQMVEEEVEEEAKEAETKEGEGGGADAAVKQKKKITKTALEFTVSRPYDWTTEEVNTYHEIEVAMANTDRVVRETADMRNELESYIYDMRDKIISDSGLGPYGTEKEKTAFSKKNEEMENWLYDDEGFNATKKVYAEKLAQLKKLGGPIEYRQSEAAGRPTAQSNLQAALELYRNWVNNEGSSLAHITDEERQKVSKMCDETSAWMYEQMDKQGDLPLDVDPVLTTEKLNVKLTELKRECGPIMRKPVPKAPAPTTKKQESANKDAPEEGNKEDPMEVDEKNGDAEKPTGDAMEEG